MQRGAKARSVASLQLLAALAVGMGSAAVGRAETSLIIAIEDVRSQKSTDAVSVRLESEEDASREAKRVGDGEYAIAMSPDSRKVAILIDVRDPLVSRRITTRRLLDPLKPRTRMKVYVAAAGPVEYTNSARNLALYCAPGQYDACLSYTEQAAHQIAGAGTDGLVVRVKYNYAQALRYACEYLSYDTCKHAAVAYEELISAYRGHEGAFSSERVDIANVRGAKEAAKRIEASSRYQFVRDLYQARRFKAAAMEAEEMAEAIRSGEISVDGTGISLDRLLIDAGSAWSRYGDVLRSGPVQDREMVAESYRRAQKNLSAVSARTEGIARYLADVERKIAATEPE